MADQLISQLQDMLEGQIDFAGQKKTESMTTATLAITGAMAFIIGYIQQDIHLTLWIGLGGALLTFFMVVPPWPMYNEDPERWLPKGTEITGMAIEVDGKKVN